MGGPSIPAEATRPSRRRSTVLRAFAQRPRNRFLSTFRRLRASLECYRRTESIVPQQALGPCRTAGSPSPPCREDRRTAPLAGSTRQRYRCRVHSRRIRDRAGHYAQCRRRGRLPASDRVLVQDRFRGEHSRGSFTSPDQSRARSFESQRLRHGEVNLRHAPQVMPYLPIQLDASRFNAPSLHASPCVSLGRRNGLHRSRHSFANAATLMVFARIHRPAGNRRTAGRTFRHAPGV